MDQVNNQINRFVNNNCGDASIQFALIAGAMAIGSALLVPMVFKGNAQIASSDKYGVDRTVTGSINPVKPVKRYHIRTSVLDNSK